MKTYQTWEIIKMLTENPKLKFQLDNWGDSFLTIVDDKLGLGSKNGFWDLDENQKDRFDIINYLSLKNKWTLVQEPVSFMEAFEALQERKDIRVDFRGRITEFKGDDVDEYIFKENQIKFGTWYIEAK